MLMEACARIEALDTIQAVWSEGLEALAREGVTVVLHLATDTARQRTRALVTAPDIYASWPPERDPFLAHCCSSYAITPTGIAFREDYDYLDDAERHFIAGARAHGFRTGLAIPVRMRGGARFGGFNLGTDLERAEFERRILPHRERFRLFCLVLHRRLEELGFDLSQPGAPAVSDDPTRFGPPQQRGGASPLSPREREVLLLQVQGLQRKEVARICAISPHTVAEYTAKAYRKLGVHNRMEAARVLLADE